MPKSKREILREKRLRRQRLTRILTVTGITLLALVVGYFLISSAGNKSTGNDIDASVTPIFPRNFNTTVNRNTIGDPNAPVRVDVFEDFQCPACANFTFSIESRVIQAYVETGKAFYTFHVYPFLDEYSDRPEKESDMAANAALCAADQGKFWDYHDILYMNWNGENQGSFRKERILAFGRALSLNMDAFGNCVEEMSYANVLAEEMTLGEEWGVQGTPSLFVNGTIVSPGFIPSFDEISAAIEAALQGQ